MLELLFVTALTAGDDVPVKIPMYQFCQASVIIEATVDIPDEQMVKLPDGKLVWIASDTLNKSERACPKSLERKHIGDRD